MATGRRSILKILARKTFLQHHQAATFTTQPHRWKSCLASTLGLSQSATSQAPQGLSKFVLRGLISRGGMVTSPNPCALGGPIRWCLEAETGSWEAVVSGLGQGERLELVKHRRTTCTWGAGGPLGPGPPLTSCRLCACSNQQIFHLYHVICPIFDLYHVPCPKYLFSPADCDILFVPSV